MESSRTGRRSNSMRYKRSSSQNFIHDSFSSSIDFPAYINWQTLSSSVNEQLRHGSIKINKSNLVEWADTIKEEREKTPLLPHKHSPSSSKDSSSETPSSFKGGISWAVAAFLLVNCALGAGVLNYPSAYYRVGGVAVATFIQLILMAVLSATMIVLVYSADINHDDTYHDVLLSMCGKKAQHLSAISIMLTCYGICITFLIVIGDQYDRIIVSWVAECTWYVDRRFTITATAVVFIWPMCYFRRLDFLRYFGTLGVFVMLYVVFLNIYMYIHPSTRTVEATLPVNTIELLAVIPVFTFAYQCHEIVIPVYACMEKRTVRNFSKATALALFILFVLYNVTGTCGYLTFGDKITPDIMQLYDPTDPIVMIGIIALIIKMISAYPPIIVCGRGALDGMYAEYFKIGTEEFIRGEYKRRIIITTIWFFSALAFAIFTPNIGVVIELLGSLASMNVFIFPSLCMLALTKRPEIKLRRCSKILVTIFSGFLIAAGIISFVLVLIQVYFDLVTRKPPTHEVLC